MEDVMAQRNGSRVWHGALTRLIVWSVAVLAAMPSLTACAGGADDPGSNNAIVQRLDALERQNDELRTEVARLRQQVDSPTPSAQTAGAPVAADLAPERDHGTPVQVGFRTGWAESPYAMPGGLFYSAFLNHLLLSEEDGIPYGHVTGELMAGVILGNHAVTTANLASQLGVTGAVSSSLSTLEIEPTVQYHADFAHLGLPQLAGVDPYILGGPGIWVSMMTTPVVVKGSVAGRGYRHEDADLQPGGVFGFGSTLHLGQLLDLPAAQGLLDKSTLGAEWRYNYLANGQGINQYTGSLAFGF
jgi:hypothetical protein